MEHILRLCHRTVYSDAAAFHCRNRNGTTHGRDSYEYRNRIRELYSVRDSKRNHHADHDSSYCDHQTRTIHSSSANRFHSHRGQPDQRWCGHVHTQGSESSTTITQDNQPEPTVTDDTIDPATAVPPGRLLLATGLHARAEKSFSNVNRVICDETTRFYTTSVKPFTVRNTKLTSTITLTDYYYATTTFEDTVSTTTETPVDYEETTEMQAFTESTTSLFYETTTVTPTIELSELPRSTAYAACGADNFIGGIAGHGIVGVSLEPRDRSGVTTPQFTADSPRSCCEACVSQTDTPCVGSVWFLDMCFFIVNTEQCDGSEAMISFDLSRDREVLANEGMILSNGACGQQVWSGRYCDEFSGNCDGADPTPSELSPAPTEIT